MAIGELFAALAVIATMMAVPALLVAAILKRARGFRPAPGQAPPRRTGWIRPSDEDGDREPRRPRPFAGAGAVALEIPVERTFERTPTRRLPRRGDDPNRLAS